MMRVVFMGTPQFSVPTLQALIDAPDVSVVGVLCSPDKPVGRHQVLTAPPVKALAEQHHLPVFQPERLKDNDGLYDTLAALDADFFVVVAYGFIIPKRFLALPRLMPINIHGSLLPAYRGASPIQAALLAGDRETGLTYIRMVSAMDAGPMLLKVPYHVPSDATADHLFGSLSTLAGNHILEVLRGVASGELTEEDQDTSLVSFCGKIDKAMGQIDVHQSSAEEIYHRWQAFTSWPGIYTIWEGKRLKLLHCRPDTQQHLEAGTVTEEADGLHIGTTSGTIIVSQLQLEGKKAMSSAEFLQGHSRILTTGL